MGVRLQVQRVTKRRAAHRDIQYEASKTAATQKAKHRGSAGFVDKIKEKVGRPSSEQPS